MFRSEMSYRVLISELVLYGRRTAKFVSLDKREIQKKD